MAEDEKQKKVKDSDLMTDLLRQMGLCEEEIGAALDLAKSIEQKVEAKSKDTVEVTPSNLIDLSKEELIQKIEKLQTELDHFHNVVAIQFILLIKKYKDRVISLENKLRQKNAQIQELSQRLSFLQK
ncbi:MAG: hypothetical protein ACTSYB_18530 [Candidatus Helarchaeota archaeon]